MTIDATRAKAEGLPEVNRRLLLGLAAASTAAAFVPPASAGAATEDAELVRLGGHLSELVHEYRASKTAVAAILRIWGPRWPPAPKAICSTCGPEMERDIEGRGIARPARFGEARPPRIWTVKDIRPHLEAAETRVRFARTDRSKAARREALAEWRMLLVAAQSYEAACEGIHQVSGYRPAHVQAEAARNALLDHVDATLNVRADTIAGVVIQAQAIQALQGIPVLSRISRKALLQDIPPTAPRWGDMLALSLLRIAESGAP